MGAWTFVEALIPWVLDRLSPAGRRLRYTGRAASASTATGLMSKHIQEQKALVNDALNG
jgi:2-oxoglutarate dehydrogenase E1 component